MNKKDPFEKVPEFLAAFENIAKNGFFGSIKFEIMGNHEGVPMYCLIMATGHVPSDEKWRVAGCATLVDPAEILSKTREFVKKEKIKTVTVAVNSENWNLYDKKGEKIIGSKGTQTVMNLHINFV